MARKKIESVEFPIANTAMPLGNRNRILPRDLSTSGRVPGVSDIELNSGTVVISSRNQQIRVGDGETVYTKYGSLGNDDLSNAMYGIGAYNASGLLVTGTGLIGTDDKDTPSTADDEPIYGTVVYDVNNKRVIMLRSSDRMLEVKGYSSVIADATKQRFKYFGSEASVDLYPSNTLSHIIFNIKGNQSGVDEAYMRVAGFVSTTFDNNVYPATDNTRELGNASFRWSLIRGVTITAGDLAFEETHCHITGEKFLPGDEICLIMTRFDEEGAFIRTVPVLKHRSFCAIFLRKLRNKAKEMWRNRWKTK